jgi:hypothetical protein
MQTAGYSVPSLETLAQYHPQFALAMAMGVPVRPNIRPLSVELQNSQVGQPQRSSFSTVISQYSVFAGLDVTIDPTNNLIGNPLKYIADAAQPLTSGITVSLLISAASGVNYSPVPDETPLGILPRAFASSVGTWAMRNPENMKAGFTLQTAAEGDNFTVWLVFTFLVLASEGDGYFNIPADQARARLAALGLVSPRPALPVGAGG